MRRGQTKTRDRYFEFLYELGFGDDRHYGLAGYLHSIPFRWSFRRDENRVYDGSHMRREFEEEEGEDATRYFDMNDDECSMLEFFVGFAYRLCRDMFENISCQEFVEAMLSNLGLWDYDDDNDFSDGDVLEDISEALDDWVDRKYSYNGEGGLFPLVDAPENLRGVEMWTQASWWYNENYT